MAHKHYLTVTEEHFQMAIHPDKIFGDKLGMQTPANVGKTSHDERPMPITIQENASFSQVVGIFENALVAEEGLEPPTRGL